MRKMVVLIVLFSIVACGVIFVAVRERQQSAKKATSSNTKSDQEVSKISGTSDEVVPPLSVKNRPTIADLKLVLSNPAETTVSSSTSTVAVTGATLPYTSVIVNEFELTSDAEGNFTKNISLDEGDNYISIIVYTAEGASAEKEILVIRTISD